MTGTAIVAVGNGKVEIREIKVPRVDEWDIRVALERSAISAGTESHVVRSIANINKPLVLGYAPIGRIEAVGEKAAALFAVGDRVSYFCPSPSTAGPDNCSGGHQSPAVLNVNPLSRDLLGADQYCIKVPNGLSSEYAAFGGIAAVSSMGAMMPRTKPGDKVLVLGQGIIGQFAAQHFRMHGAEVTISDLHSKRIDVALVCGADHAINVAAEDTVQALKEIWPTGADIVADTTGSYRVVEASVGAVRKRGRYVFLGWCKGTDFNLEIFHGQSVFEAYFPWTLEGPHVQHSWRMMIQGGLMVEPIITHRVHVSEASSVYEMILNTPQKYVGVVFDWE